MRNQSQIDQTQTPTPKREGRSLLIRIGRRVAILLLIAIGLLLIGAIYESVTEAADTHAYPPPGQLIDVGGFRLHIDCKGTGAPTVVIDAGLGDWSTMWSFVQAGVAKTTRVCTYDRAGMGWSDTGPMPRDAKQFSKELHILLQQAEIPAPYVLAGHSLGGFPVRVYAHDYPAEVVGVVLIDSMSPAQFKQLPAEAPSQQPSQIHPFSILTLLARFAIVRLLAKPLGLIPYLPADEKAYFANFVRPQNMQAFTDESRGLPASAVEAEAVKSFGDLPLLVLSGGLNQQADWQSMQANLLQLSSDSHQLIAAQSGHNIEIDQPQAAIEAITTMVTQLRQTSP